MIRPAVGGAGTGSHGFDGVVTALVPSKTGTGWWDYDGTTLTAAAGQDGAYDLYNVEVQVHCFINDVPADCFKDGVINLRSADAIKLPLNYFVRVLARNNSDTVWTVHVFSTVYREQTV